MSCFHWTLIATWLLHRERKLTSKIILVIFPFRPAPLTVSPVLNDSTIYLVAMLEIGELPLTTLFSSHSPQSLREPFKACQGRFPDVSHSLSFIIPTATIWLREFILSHLNCDNRLLTGPSISSFVPVHFIF